MWTPGVLSIVYRPEDRLTQSAHRLDDDAVCVDFLFPAYGRTTRPIDHVSAVQISAAIIEGVYCALECASISGSLGPEADVDWFYRTAMDWVLARSEVRYKTQVLPEVVVSLTFKVHKAMRRHGRLITTVTFDGFCAGAETWMLRGAEQPDHPSRPL